MDLQRNFSPTSSDMGFNNISNNNNSDNNLFNILLIIAVIIVVYIFINYDCNVEKMSNGVIDQLFAKDQQDMHLNAGIDNIASGRFNLYWNQPTLIANTSTNRGKLYNLPQYVRGVNSSDTNYSEMINLTNDVANINKNNTINGNNNVLEIEKLTHKTQHLNDPAALGNGPGGYRLNTDIVNPIYNGPEYVNLDGNIIYPNGYVGDLFMQPKPDINIPLPIMGNTV